MADQANPARLLRRASVLDRTGQSNSTLERAMRSGVFPRPVKIGPRAVAWPESAVNAWIEQRIRGVTP